MKTSLLVFLTSVCSVLGAPTGEATDPSSVEARGGDYNDHNPYWYHYMNHYKHYYCKDKKHYGYYPHYPHWYDYIKDHHDDFCNDYYKYKDDKHRRDDGEVDVRDGINVGVGVNINVDDYNDDYYPYYPKWYHYVKQYPDYCKNYHYHKEKRDDGTDLDARGGHDYYKYKDYKHWDWVDNDYCHYYKYGNYYH